MNSTIRIAITAALFHSLTAFSTATANDGHVTVLNSDGALVQQISFPMLVRQQVTFVEWGNGDNLWAGVHVNGGNAFTFQPNDVVRKYSPTGTELLTVKGPVRSQTAFTDDSDGNLYIGGSPDGGSLSDIDVYKFDAAGNFLNTLAPVEDEWMDLTTVPGNRLYFSSSFINEPAHGIYEYTPGGTQVNRVGSFDGQNRYGAELERSFTDGTLWSWQPINGIGTNYVVNLNLDLSTKSFFALGPSPVTDLAALPNGNLMLHDPFAQNLIEITPTGGFVRILNYSALGLGFVEDIDVNGSGQIALIDGLGPLNLPEPATMTLAVAAVSFAGLVRRRRAN